MADIPSFATRIGHQGILELLKFKSEFPMFKGDKGLGFVFPVWYYDLFLISLFEFRIGNY